MLSETRINHTLGLEILTPRLILTIMTIIVSFDNSLDECTECVIGSAKLSALQKRPLLRPRRNIFLALCLKSKRKEKVNFHLDKDRGASNR